MPNGVISVDVVFDDSTVVAGAESLKTSSLRGAKEYQIAKVAVLEGTVGTAVQILSVSPAAYVDASGQLVSFTTLNRIVAQGDPHIAVGSLFARWGNSRDGNVAVFDSPLPNGPPNSVQIFSESTQATYTLILTGT